MSQTTWGFNLPLGQRLPILQQFLTPQWKLTFWTPFSSFHPYLSYMGSIWGEYGCLWSPYKVDFFLPPTALTDLSWPRFIVIFWTLSNVTPSYLSCASSRISDWAVMPPDREFPCIDGSKHWCFIWRPE